MDKSKQTVGVDVILNLAGADRSAIAYAFLYAAFKRTEISSSPVRDALDCLTPFLLPYLHDNAGRPIDLSAMQAHLKSKYGFDIPLYALEQLLPTLASQGHAEYNKIARGYIAKKSDSKFDVVKSEIETDFDTIVNHLNGYAKASGLNKAPSSPSWGDALLSFLKANPEDTPAPFTKIKGAIVDPTAVERTVCAAFLKDLHDKNKDAFEKVVKIFMGVLIEEFISSITEIGELKSQKRPAVYYDTAVLLRVLGCSGTVLRTATQELTQYLQDLGIPIYFLSGNETEAANIFSAIVFTKDSGKELEGETAEAISAGEISITDIRMLQNSFAERLAAINIFPADRQESEAQKLARYQIDENAFASFLVNEAHKSKRVYGQQNRLNDASYLGTIMRLRAGVRTRDLIDCGHLFITTNRFLASASRRFLILNKAIGNQHCPPILSVGQVATIAWLMKDRVLSPEKAGRELLANCFAAVSPDAEWFKYFREGFEKAVGPAEDIGNDQQKALVMHAARRIAREESFGNTALVRSLNMAEILSRAQEEVVKIEQAARNRAQRDIDEAQKANATAIAQVSQESENRISKLREEHQKAAEQSMIEKAAAVAQANRLAEERKSAEFARRNHQRAEGIANKVVVAIRTVWVLAFLTASFLVWRYQVLNVDGVGPDIVAFLLMIISVIGFADMLGWHLAQTLLARIRAWIAKKIYAFLSFGYE